MFTLPNLSSLLLILVVCSCQSNVNKLNVKDRNLDLTDGIMLYEGKPYSGVLFSKIDTLTTYTATYLDGKKHGEERKFFYDGRLASSGFYTQGKKSGTHRTWWNRDQLKSEYTYDDSGNYIGKQLEWYRNGQLSKEFHYNMNGEQDGTQKLWNLAGRIKANYEVINGKSYGLIESKDCKSAVDPL